jgi:hypothetical protein
MGQKIMWIMGGSADRNLKLAEGDYWIAVKWTNIDT